LNLELRSPLFYKKLETLPSFVPGRDDEFLLCYELNPAQAAGIEPDREQLLGPLQFAGQKEAVTQEVTLPAGNYLFVQHRGETILDREKWLDMAVEQQKDGLWERNKLGRHLYVRFLFEDGNYVTQVFREVIKA